MSTEVETLPPAESAGGSAVADGTLIGGKYLVEKTIAQGGIGIIVAAKNLALQQRVAIKYLKPKAAKDADLVDRFLREARLSARITSDHVVKVFDVGTLSDGTPFMVMEFLTGHDLGRVVETGPSPVIQAVDYVLQACDALAEAHALNIVHRDLKPENLFLAQRPSNTPIVKIIDFGISKVAPHRDDEGTWTHNTAATDRFGTPLYMSPEQLRASAGADGRSDIWSMGVVLYELLTGTLPFDGDDLPQLCTSVLTGEPRRLTKVRPDIAPELEAVVLRCLEKDPSNRFRNVAELVQELVPFGPPLSAQRAVRIREVVMAGGASIRPPTSETPLTDSQPSRRDYAATQSRIFVKVPAAPGSAFQTRKMAIGVGAVLVCAISILLVYLGHGASRPLAARAGPEAPAAIATSVPVAPDSVVTPAPSAPAGAVPPPEYWFEALPRATSARPKPAAASPPRSVVSTSSASGRQAVPVSSPGDRRALFGERN